MPNDLDFPELPSERRRRRQMASPYDQPLGVTPEEESNLLSKTAGGLQYIAETLDKPGAAVRGVLGGQGVDALKNLVPFSDTFGWTDPKQRIYGSDLLEQWGFLAPKDHDGFDWTNLGDWGRGAAGLAVDVATDPLSWVGGPLSKPIAKGAEVISHTPVTLSKALRAGEAPLATLHAPFWAEWLGASKEPIAELSAKSFGGKAQGIANAAAAANDFLAYKMPIVKHLRGLLSPSASGVASPGGSQWPVWDEATQILNDLNYSTRATAVGDFTEHMLSAGKAQDSLLKTFTEIAEHHAKEGNPMASELFKEYTRGLVTGREGIPDPAKMATDLQSLLQLPEDTLPDAVEKTAKLADQMHQVLTSTREGIEQAHARVSALGYRIGTLDDAYNAYWPRTSADAASQKALDRYLNRSAGLPENTIRPDMARRTDLKNVPGGDVFINQQAKRPAVMGFEIAEDRSYVPMKAAAQKQALIEEMDARGIAYPEKADLKTLRALRMQDDIKARLDSEWLDKSPVLLDDAGMPLESEIAAGKARLIGHNKDGVPQYATYQSEQERWLGIKPETNKRDLLPSEASAKAEPTVGQATLDLIDKLDAMSPETIRSYLKGQMRGASGLTKKILQEQLDQVGNGIWEHGIYGQHVIDDAVAYRKWMAETESTMRSTHHFLATPGIVANTKAQPEWATLESVWENTKLHGHGFAPEGLETFARNNAQQLGIDAATLADPAKLKEAIADLRIAPSAEGALRSYQQITQPHAQNRLLDLWDTVTNYYKTGLYSVWPASHIRNLGSDLWQHASSGRAPLAFGPKGGILGRAKDAYRYLAKEGKIKDAEFFDEYVALVHSGEAGSTQVIDTMGERLGAKFGGKPEGGLAWVLKGKATPEETKWDFAKRILSAGPRAQQETEFVSRAGYFAALRDEGYSASQALQMVKQSGFDYAEASAFERKVAKRLVPFWLFSARNIPWQFAKIFNQPGGITAQSARMISQAASAGSSEIYTPSFLQENQSVPFRSNPDAQSFFRNSMIPLGDFNDVVFDGAMPNVGRTLTKPLARLHPLLNILPEMFADKQFYTGRKISDLASPTAAAFGPATSKVGGAVQGAVDRAIHYSPASRLVSEAWSVLDPRKNVLQKASNLAGTGSVSTYDVADWKLRDLRNAYADELKNTPGVRQWQDFFLPKDAEQTIPADKLEMAKAKMKRRGQLTKILSERRKAKQSQ